MHEVKDAKNKAIKLSAALNVGDNEEFDFVRSLYGMHCLINYTWINSLAEIFSIPDDWSAV